MLCEDCRKKPATVHVTKIINNQKTERHLCEECAAQGQQITMGFTPDFSVNQFLSNLLNYDQPKSNLNVPIRQNFSCKQCNLPYEQFVRGGKMGCSHCYDTFDSQIDNLLKRIHGSESHVGKVPKRGGSKFRVQREIKRLRQRLHELIRNEEFEAAAEVRDNIKALENELGA